MSNIFSKLEKMLKVMRYRWNKFCIRKGLENFKKMQTCSIRKNDLLLEIIILENSNKSSVYENILFIFPDFYESLFENKSLLIASLYEFCSILDEEINKYERRMNFFFLLIF